MSAGTVWNTLSHHQQELLVLPRRLPSSKWLARCVGTSYLYPSGLDDAAPSRRSRCAAVWTSHQELLPRRRSSFKWRQDALTPLIYTCRMSHHERLVRSSWCDVTWTTAADEEGPTIMDRILSMELFPRVSEPSSNLKILCFWPICLLYI